MRRRLRSRVWWRGLWSRRATAVVLGVALGLIGGWLGIVAGGPSQGRVGPLTVDTAVVPSWPGGSTIHLPPLGSVRLPTHRGPVGIDTTVQGIDLGAAQRWLGNASDPAIEQQSTSEVEAALRWAVARAVAAALVGSVLLTLLVTRRPLAVASALVTTVAVLVVGGVWAVATYDSAGLRQPTFSGELVNAPRVVGDISAVPQDLSQYGTELAGLVDNLTRVMHAVDELPVGPSTGDSVVLVHISDIHLAVQAWPLVRQVASTYGADAIIDTGDVADHGTAIENAALSPIASLGLPYIYVKGNHDSTATVSALRAMPDVTVLDDSTVTVDGLTVAGAGDPRFTPDKSTRSDGPLGDDEVQRAAARLRTFVTGWDSAHRERPVDVVAFHDPAGAVSLDGVAPTLLFGHLHTRYTWVGKEGSRILVQGSTGGAGLRALQGERPTPVTLSVLYFSRADGRLTAFDDITLGGLGTTTAEVSRIVVEPDGRTPVDAVPDGLDAALAPLSPPG